MIGGTARRTKIACPTDRGRALEMRSMDQAAKDCIFCRIVRSEIPSRKLYEDEEIIAFHDINPCAPVHFMLVPKRHIASLAEATEQDAGVLGRIMVLTGRLAREQ